MDVYAYMAGNNPMVAKAIIEGFGYRCQGRDMAHNLRELVANEGEPALRKIMLNHPDRDVIVEISEKPKKPKKSSACSCGSTKGNDHFMYLNAAGQQQQSEAARSGSQMNIAIIAVALLFATAIIVKK